MHCLERVQELQGISSSRPFHESKMESMQCRVSVNRQCMEFFFWDSEVLQVGASSSAALPPCRTLSLRIGITPCWVGYVEVMKHGIPIC